jgi:hypothetical protein
VVARFSPDCGASLMEGELQHAQSLPSCSLDTSRCAGCAGKLKRGGCSALLVTDPNGDITCPLCHEPSACLIGNDGCCHAACQSCWLGLAAEQVEEQVACASDLCLRQLCVRCPQSGCKKPLGKLLLRYVRRESKVMVSHEAWVTQNSSLGVLNDLDAQSLVFSATPSEAGPLCPNCGTRAYALIRSCDHGHAVCLTCVFSMAESQVGFCRSRLQRELNVPCAMHGCTGTVGPDVNSFVLRTCPVARTFEDDMQAEMIRLQKGGQKLVCDVKVPGMECIVCRVPRLALLESPGCAHSACEDCWVSWAASQLAVCRVEKRSFRCLGVGCRERACRSLWERACALNEAVRSFNVELMLRERLQNNRLYPAEVQVDCPHAGCLGLGYLGFDTVMCFACEHSWSAEDFTAVPPPDVDVELLCGEAMKKCPGCGEHIIKNGGCDHMTCRCGHQFWWSTLNPFAR